MANNILQKKDSKGWLVLPDKIRMVVKKSKYAGRPGKTHLYMGTYSMIISMFISVQGQKKKKDFFFNGSGTVDFPFG